MSDKMSEVRICVCGHEDECHSGFGCLAEIGLDELCECGSFEWKPSASKLAPLTEEAPKGPCPAHNTYNYGPLWCAACHPRPTSKVPASPVGELEGALYVASRASIPERAAMWRGCRAEGFPIVSTWIDEAGEGETSNLSELWDRIAKEVASASALVLYIEPQDLPLKGALIEVGMALALKKRVFAVMPGVELEDRSMRPVGSWLKHPLVSICHSVDVALRAALSSKPAPEGIPQPNLRRFDLDDNGCGEGIMMLAECGEYVLAEDVTAIISAKDAEIARNKELESERLKFWRDRAEAAEAELASLRASSAKVREDALLEAAKVAAGHADSRRNPTLKLSRQAMKSSALVYQCELIESDILSLLPTSPESQEAGQ